ncbi:MAG: hypothetical protein MRZ79_19400 [Bacteroidia bacterium]|nr:hypothetical protein [Bacteroidia bacterium]
MGGLFSQIHQIGLPPITNYSKQDYQAETQNWAIKQDNRGIMYFGNNEGLLEFDGSSWKLYTMPNKCIVRSIANDDKGKLYIGGQDELGYFFPNEQGSLIYHSLVDLIPADYRKFEDVWKIFVAEEGVYWCTQRWIFLQKDSSIQVIMPENKFENYFFVDEKLYVQDQTIGLKYWDGTKLQLIPFTKEISQKRISEVFALEDEQLLIFTSEQGIFTLKDGVLESWEEEVADYLMTNRIYSVLSLRNGYWAIGTSLNGLLILKEGGKPFRKINKGRGLPNNSILCMLEDSEGNLWLGLENGISHIELQSPFSFLDDRLGVEGTAYSSAIHNNSLYLATNQGIYFQNWSNPPDPLSKGQFDLVKTSQEGANWSLDLVDGELIAGKHEGAFKVDGDQILPMSNVQGAWTFQKLRNQPNMAIEGTYNGFLLYKKIGQKWVYQRKLEGFDESARVVAQDQKGRIWVTHPYRGVYRIVLAADGQSIASVDYFNSKHGLPSNLSINVAPIQDMLFFTTEKGIYTFIEEKEIFQPYEDFNELFGDEVVVNRLIEDEQKNIWFSTENEFGLLKITEGIVQKEVNKLRFNQLSQRLVKGFEHIYAYDPNHIFIGIDEGFILYNPKKDAELSTTLPVYIRKVNIINGEDSSVFDGNFVENGRLSGKQTKGFVLSFPESSNDFRFSFSAPYFEYINQVSYQYFLEGEDKKWSGWTRKNEKEYTNLSPGSYTFKVKAQNIYGIESEVTSYKFTIKGPWYQSNIAKLIFLLLTIGLIFLAFYIQNQNLKRKADLQLQKQTAHHQKKEDSFREEVQKSEAEIFKLKNEKLEAEMSHKKKELASYAMHLVQKSEMLLTIKQQLERLKKETPPKNQPQLKQLLRTIEDDIQLDKDWEKFEFHFDEVHEQFLKQLKDRFPNLTAKDKKLCAYLRMNLSTKEIAPLMGISVRGVEIGRYRLRKKLDLPSDANLNEFMMNLA